MNPFDKLQELVLSLKDDFGKFYNKNNAAAGTRVRKGMQEVKDMAQEIRLQVQANKNKEAAE